MKRFLYKSTGVLISGMLLLTSATLCLPQTGAAKAKKKVTGITLKKPVISTLYLKKGESYKISYKVKPAKATNRKIAFSSSKKKVASVSAKGVIRAKKPGTAKIRLTAKDGSGTKAVVQVKVCKKLKKIKKIKLTCPRSVLYVNGGQSEKSTTLSYKLSPAKTTVKKVVFKTSDKKIATVSAKGVVTAKAVGTVTITAYAADGRGAKASCKIQIKKEKSSFHCGTGIADEPSTVNPDVKQMSVRFQTPYNFHSYSVVRASLPQGVKVADVTELQFVTENEKPLEFRLYAGPERTADKELTKETVTIRDEITGTGTAVVGGKEIPKTSHQLTLQKTESTRITRKAGDKEASAFTLDAEAATLLQKSSAGEQLQFCLYPHNCQPDYVLSSLQIQSNGKTYDVPLNKETIGGKDGALLTYRQGK